MCCCRSFLRPSLILGGSLGSRGPGGLPGGRGFGGFTASVIGLGGFPGCSGNDGLGITLGGPLSLRGGGRAPGFNGGPFAAAGGCSALFLLAFLCAEGLGEGEDENDPDLERLPLKELC